MNVGLIDVDGHNFPNLALMRISAWHKAQGDQVEWWMGDLFHYDVVYKSKVFSDAYSKDAPDPLNCDKVIKGGTGYNISLRGGVECFDAEHHETLPAEMERMFPEVSWIQRMLLTRLQWSPMKALRQNTSLLAKPSQI